MKVIVCLVLQAVYVAGVIRKSALMNKLINVKPVGPPAVRKFVPLTEIPPPMGPHVHPDGRRHLEDCTPTPWSHNVVDEATVQIIGDYYDDNSEKTVATVIIPDHIDKKHFEVTTQVPYFTVGTIDALGFHPTKPPALNDCEKIYQDHMNEQYSEGVSSDYSEESLEMARVPAEAMDPEKPPMDVYDDKIYQDPDQFN
ncbi:uncharacterized protein LOC133522264 [Cydia pomonella]|uniref:uncharacterized protein LOC133522264 n=1 Tax=Cydia pomonella TaxID=82600 RepID=UPI002ADE35A4|nr:uncharacterized protein LOC133522264 [Cydia pomonella]